MKIMNELDKELLNLLQKGLPLTCDPYGNIGEKLGIGRHEIVERIQRLKEEGYIRRLGGTFDANAMGYQSALFAAKVPEENFEQVADYLSGLPFVTHNYRRNASLNMWFTLSTPEQQEKEKILKRLREELQVETILELPKVRNFKLEVFFDMKEKHS